MSEATQLEKLKEDRTKLKARVNELNAQNRQFNEDLQSARQALAESDEVVARAEKAEETVDLLKGQLSTANEEIKSLQKKLARSEKDADSLNAIKAALGV